MRKFICVIVAIIIIGALVFAFSKSEKEKGDDGLSKPPKEFKVGMTMQETKNIITEEYAVEQSAVEYREKPSQEEYDTTEEFMIELKQKGITLHFNHNRVLIRIEKDSVDQKNGENEEKQRKTTV
ncbi:MAG: hypothetical protein J6333_11170 [Planctomycetes bacterium]|nr:hypothetical protein [Planctomycetota bacterium]